MHYYIGKEKTQKSGGKMQVNITVVGQETHMMCGSIRSFRKRRSEAGLYGGGPQVVLSSLPKGVLTP